MTTYYGCQHCHSPPPTHTTGREIAERRAPRECSIIPALLFPIESIILGILRPLPPNFSLIYTSPMASGHPWSPAVSACAYCLHEAEALLASALPCLDACMQAMNSISKMDLKEVASFKRPPQLLVPVCDCVLLLLGLKPGFEAFAQLFGKPDGIQLLLQYDKDNIPPKVLSAVAAHIASMPSPDAMRSVSKAGVGLVRWCQGA